MSRHHSKLDLWEWDFDHGQPQIPFVRLQPGDTFTSARTRLLCCAELEEGELLHEHLMHHERIEKNVTYTVISIDHDAGTFVLLTHRGLTRPLIVWNWGDL